MAEISSPYNNPHYPVIKSRWDKPQDTHESFQSLFQQPRDIFENDIPGAQPRPQIDISVAPRNSHEKIADSPNRPNLFAAPRQNMWTLENANARQNNYIPSCREPSPARPRLFAYVPRENTKYAAKSVPQIDMSKIARNPVGCDPNSLSARRKLFEVPRETMKYTDIDGSHPKLQYGSDRSPRDIMGNLIPNSGRRYVHTNDGEDIQGSHSKPEIDLTKAPRDPFLVVNEPKRKLFEQPRDNMILADGMKKPRPPTHHKDDTPLNSGRRRLFAVPREAMKYGDVEKAKPAKFFPERPKITPTFGESGIFD